MNSSLDTNDAPFASPAFDALQRNGEARPICVLCGAEIVDNHWFGRLPRNGNGEASAESLTILLCSPRCALRHFTSLRPPGNGFDEYEQHERSVHLLIDGEKPAWL